MYLVQVFSLYVPCLFSISGNGGVEGNPVHPCGDLGFASESRERFPKLEYDFLKKIIANFAITLVHETHLVDQSLMLVNQVNKFFFVPDHQWRFLLVDWSK